MNTMHESTSAAATFKSADGLLNFDAVFKLQTQIADILKKAQKAGKDVKATGYFVVSTRAKPVAYSAASAKKDDIRYQVRRATKVASRKNVKPEALARVKILLTLLDGADVPAALKAKIKDAATAISQHSAKLEKVKASIDKKKAVLREASEKAHGLAVADLKKVLEAGGVPEKNIVEAQGFMGKAILVKLSATSVVSIGKSDIKKFNAARRANTSTSSVQVSISSMSLESILKTVPGVKDVNIKGGKTFSFIPGSPKINAKRLVKLGWEIVEEDKVWKRQYLTNSEYPGISLLLSDRTGDNTNTVVIITRGTSITATEVPSTMKVQYDDGSVNTIDVAKEAQIYTGKKLPKSKNAFWEQLDSDYAYVLLSPRKKGLQGRAELKQAILDACYKTKK